MGRPRKITKEVVGKLEYAFMKGFNISEACDYAAISRDTYYEKLKQSKEFSDRMERAKTNLQRKAKLNLAEAIESGNLDESKYYLERKCKNEQSKEFSDRMERAKTNLQRKAKLNLAEAIESGNLDESKYYLERKCKNEFSVKQEINVAGEINHSNPFESLTTEELKKLIHGG